MMVSIIRDEEELLRLADLPNRSITGRGVEPNIAEIDERQAEHRPEVSPFFGLHALDDSFDIADGVIVRQQS